MCGHGSCRRPQRREMRHYLRLGWRLYRLLDRFDRTQLQDEVDLLRQEADSLTAETEVWDATSSRLLTNPPRGSPQDLCDLLRAKRDKITLYVRSPHHDHRVVEKLHQWA